MSTFYHSFLLKFSSNISSNYELKLFFTPHINLLFFWLECTVECMILPCVIITKVEITIK